MSINDITTPLDSATLDSDSQYELYYKMVKHVLDEFEVNLVEWNHYKICTKEELKSLEEYCKRLSFSLKAMQLKYRFDEERMKVDLTESGFPNYLELRYIHNDLDLKEEFKAKLPGADVFKEKFLRQLMINKQHVEKRDLFEASSSLYYNMIQEDKIFQKLVIGKIKKTKSTFANYVLDWAFYDISVNRPFICFMYFDYEPDEKITQEIYDTIKDCADRYQDLDNMAYMIDKRLKYVHPRKIKRVDLGILHSIFSKDDHEITSALLQAIAHKDVGLHSFSLTTTVETINSVNSSKVSNDLLSFSKQEIQVWSEVAKHKYILAPHRVIQLLYGKIPDTIIHLHHEPFEVEELPSV
ncbi:hypothetical protein IMCC3317_20690 [Kordia antarctica]|uniref:Uncharacterized protein n=1 Tax=Kordia antarctica TaxID=1218801 RepID=A0A7L4ZL97_9FLAO|nr:hypothetical protein [Kordia antarctica]QHI36704.1 hypothetical protein IMCC3317_20690 [Kordia antarctica]